jgi:hypothetical protein
LGGDEHFHLSTANSTFIQDCFTLPAWHRDSFLLKKSTRFGDFGVVQCGLSFDLENPFSKKAHRLYLQRTYWPQTLAAEGCKTYSGISQLALMAVLGPFYLVDSAECSCSAPSLTL